MQHSVVYLYGSRAHDQLKGGDVGLLWVISDTAQAQHAKQNSHQVLAKLKSHPDVGDRRIDLKIISKDSDSMSDPFVQNAIKTGILLAEMRGTSN